jgi:Carboxypeptidase regulatory-like domain
MSTRLWVSVVLLLGFARLTQPVVAQQVPRTPPGPTGTVTISRAAYDQLIDLVSRRPTPVQQPPLAGALTHAAINVRVDPTGVAATMQLDGEVFVTGPARVPLVDGATLLDARLGDQPLPLMVEGNRHFGLISGPGTFAARLDWGAPVTATAGRGSFAMPVPQSGSAVATIDVPGEQTDVQVTPGIVLRRATSNGRTTIDATLDPGSIAHVSWSTRETAPTLPREVRLLSDVKTLVSLGDADVRLVSVVTVTVIQGEPSALELRLPPGYSVSSVTGASLQQSEERPDALQLFLTNPSQRQHQFLVSLERSTAGGSFRFETALPSLAAAQRESGEIVVEGIGTLSVSASDLPGLRRVDVQEVDHVLNSSRPQSLLAAFKYQRTSTLGPVLALDVTRFTDAAVLAAVAEKAVATTLVTTEGRALTEVKLRIRNRAQPFAKVVLPPGASILSVEVAGVTAKPAEGSDGVRVPLLRPGFRPDGAYDVSFVYLHAGASFGKKGTMEMTLPRIDLPVTLVEWELFVPERYRADRFAGNSIPAHIAALAARQSETRPHALPGTWGMTGGVGSPGGSGARIGSGSGFYLSGADLAPGEIGGRVVDSQGTVVPGATVNAVVGSTTRTAVTDSSGAFVLSAVPSGAVTLTASHNGFTTNQQSLTFDQKPQRANFVIHVARLEETVTVAGASPRTPRKELDDLRASRDAEPSANVQSLQRRAAGVLPVRMEVPRAGSSHRFVKAVVVDEETTVSFRYRRR